MVSMNYLRTFSTVLRIVVIIENPVPDENTVDPWGMYNVIRMNSRTDETNGGIQV